MHNTIIFVAGRSGGHILPCINLAQELKKQSLASKFIFITTNTPLDNKILANHKWIDAHHALKLDNFPGKKIVKYPSFIWQFFICFIQSAYIIYTTKPKEIISTGGYIALPICFAAKLLRVPITLYELNVIPGKAIKVLAPFASTMHSCFLQTQNYLPNIKCCLTAYPIKQSLKKLPSQDDALKELGFSVEKKTIFILGGSQGSLFLNKLIHAIVQSTHSLQIIHQTGNDDSIDWQAFYTHQQIPAYIFSFDSAIERYYAAADVVICRAGAGTLFELIHSNKKAITIPLQIKSTDHQKYNALALAEQYPHLITVLEQQEIENNPTFFIEKLNNLIG